MMKKNCSVWVGGGEMNDSLMTREEAQTLLIECLEDGFDDAELVEYTDEEIKILPSF